MLGCCTFALIQRAFPKSWFYAGMDLESANGGLSAEREDMSGFVYDEHSGLYYNSSLGCYFDKRQQLYGDASSGQWFSFEGGQYKTVST